MAAGSSEALDVSVSVVGREEVRRLKLASGRPQDLADAEKLA